MRIRKKIKFLPNKITLLTSIIYRDKQPNKPISFDFPLFLRLRPFVRQIRSTSWNSKQKQTDLYINDPGLYPVILNKPLVAERRTGLSTMFRDITRGNEKVFINISAP